MKRAGKWISLLMGISLSFVLSLTGTLSSGHFTFPMFLAGFFISAVISGGIGLALPVARIQQSAVAKAGLKQESLPGMLLMSLISDLLFTPLMTFIMVLMNWRIASANAPAGAVPPLGIMYLRSLAICFPVGFVAIFILTPIIVKAVTGKMVRKN